MWDETPAERIKLIEGYGWMNLPKLGDVHRQTARKEAQDIRRNIASRYKPLLVPDNSMSTGTKVAIATSATVFTVLMTILKIVVQSM